MENHAYKTMKINITFLPTRYLKNYMEPDSGSIVTINSKNNFLNYIPNTQAAGTLLIPQVNV
jgi:hypothetical protein